MLGQTTCYGQHSSDRSARWTRRSARHKNCPLCQTMSPLFISTSAKPSSAQRSIRRLRAAALIFFALATSSLSAAPRGTQPDWTNAIALIRSVLQAQQEAWNRGDIDAFMNGYARSKSTTFVSEDIVRRGWETVRDRYRKKYPDSAKMGSLTFSDLEITSLGSDAALALGRWRLKRAQDQPHGRFTLVFRRLPEGWRIVHDHTSAVPPPK